ncbi:type II toxin-antitoxin system Phd/YefM family antitoxin [Gemmatimonas sp.]|uniref:type II toxin-antitoxin system Phd/YefM family antitoxin n=1 Tax=Gemmatimonas sp. TaxID=1962908 RepID=UPI0039838018
MRAPSTVAESRTIPAGVFKATCLELMDDVAATGSEIIVTKHGRRVVRVGPVNAVPTSPMGFMRGTIVRHGDLLSPDGDSWAASTMDPLLARSR